MNRKIGTIAKERINLCKSCNFYEATFHRCRQCGCFMPAKVRMRLESCPIDKWKPEPWKEPENEE
jgi:Family of unknown function (DUF6171)